MKQLGRILIIAVCASASSACGSGVGACISSGGQVDECKQDWDEAECTDWDQQEINGSSWSFHGGDSCEDLGYTVRCTDGSYGRSAC